MFSLVDVLSRLVRNITIKFIHGQTVDQFRDCVKLGCALGYAFGKSTDLLAEAQSFQSKILRSFFNSHWRKQHFLEFIV